MRIAAGLAVMAAGAYMGYSRAYGLRRREYILRGFIADMEAVAMEVEYRPRELGDIAGRLTDGQLGEFWAGFLAQLGRCESAEEAWRAAAGEYPPFGLLSGTEREAVYSAGAGLGINAAGKQLQCVRLALAECRRLLEAVRAESEDKGGMYTKLGLLGGLAAALVII